MMVPSTIIGHNYEQPLESAFAQTAGLRRGGAGRYYRTLELRQLRYFEAVARHGHFRAAAAVLHVAEPAISKQLHQLERELRVRLFDRDSRRVALTSAGEMFLERVLRILAEVDSAKEAAATFSGLERGRIRLAATHTLALDAVQLPDLLAEFNRRYPGIQAVVHLESTRSRLYELLLGREIELAFVSMPSTSNPPPEIAIERLTLQPMIVLISASHHLARRKAVAIGELKDEPFVMLRSGSLSREILIAEANRAGFTPKVAYEVNETGILRSLVARQLGIAVVPTWAFKHQDPPLGWTSLKDSRLSLSIALAWMQDAERTPAGQAFVALAHEHFTTGGSSPTAIRLSAPSAG